MPKAEHALSTLIALLVVFFTAVAIAQLPDTVCSGVANSVYPAEKWEHLQPGTQGWSADELNVAKEYAKSIGTMAWLLVENGKIVDSYGPIDKLNSLHSARKSLMSAMYGQAIADGTINPSTTLAQLGIDDIDPKLTAEEKKATIRDLLMARSGVYHVAFGETTSMKAARPERGSHAHGKFWYYNNWDFNALGTIFNQLTKQSLFDFFNDRIATPIHMQDFKLSEQQYDQGPESIHKYYNFELSARDMARFGLLFMDQGCWQGKQIIPAEWVKESTTPYSDTISKFMAKGLGYYGYLWWIANNGRFIPNTTLPDGSYAALGLGPQVILVVPSKGIVFVHRVQTDDKGDLDFSPVPTGKLGTLIELIMQAKH